MRPTPTVTLSSGRMRQLSGRPSASSLFKPLFVRSATGRRRLPGTGTGVERTPLPVNPIWPPGSTLSRDVHLRPQCSRFSREGRKLSGLHWAFSPEPIFGWTPATLNVFQKTEKNPRVQTVPEIYGNWQRRSFTASMPAHLLSALLGPSLLAGCGLTQEPGTHRGVCFGFSGEGATPPPSVLWESLLLTEVKGVTPAGVASQLLTYLGEQSPCPCCLFLFPPLVSTFIKVGKSKGRK